MGAPFSHPVPRARRRTVARLLLLVLGFAAAVTAVGAGAVVAEAAGAGGTPTGSLALVEQTPAWVTNADGLTLDVSVDSNLPTSALALSVSLYSDATARSEFESSMTGDLGDFAALPPSALIPLTTRDLASGPNGSYQLHFPVSAPGLPGQARPPAHGAGAVLSVFCGGTACAGVYPMRVSLVNLDAGAAPLDAFTTYLVLTPSAGVSGTSPLDLAWILSLGSLPAISPTGAPEIGPGTLSELRLLQSEMAAHPATSLSLQLFGQLAEAAGVAGGRSSPGHGGAASALGRQALASLRRLATATPGAELIPETYTPVDVAGLLGSGLPGELTAQLDRSRLAMKTYLGTPGQTDEYVASTSIGPATLAALAAHGITRFVVPSDDVGAPPADVVFTPMMPFLVTGSGAEAIASYPGLSAHLTGSGDAVLRANQLLADLAVIYFQGPDEPKGVALSTPVGWDPSPTFMSVVLNGLETSPIVHATTLSGLFGHVSPGVDDSSLTRRPLPAPTAAPATLPSGAITLARSRLVALESMDPAYDSLPGLEDQLLLAQTDGLPTASRTRYLGAVSRAFQDEASQFTLPYGHTITMTSLQAKVPITIFSRATGPVRVRLTVSSSYLGLGGGRTLDLVLHPRNNSVTISLAARTSGDFPLDLALSSPSGTVLTAGRLTIRSTAISGVALALSIGAVVFLLVWWSRSILQRRRKKHQQRGAELAAQVTPPPAAS